MTHLTHLGSGTPDTFAHLLAQLQSMAGNPSEGIPEGLSNYASESQVLDIVLDSSRRYLGFRGVYSTGRQLYVLEVFQVTPADGNPRLGLLCSDAEALAVHCDSAPLVHYVLGLCQEVSGMILPHFHELVAILLADGDVTLTSLDQRMQLASQAAVIHQQSNMLEELATDIKRLRSKAHAATYAPGSKAELAMDVVDETFDDLTQLPQWAADNKDRIEILPRALSGAKKSNYLRPDLICKALMILAGPYREHRAGRLSAEALSNLMMVDGFRIEGSVGPSVAGEYGDAYFVKWQGRRCFMDQHLLKGGGRDERYCMRVYFFWDAETSRVVCGELPAHLPNSLS